MSARVMPLPPEFRWPSGLPWYIGQLAAPRLEALANALGLTVEQYDEDGLGPSASVACVLPSGVVIVLTEREHLIEHFGMTGPYIEADAAEVAERGAPAILREALTAFGLDQTAVAHEPPPETAAEAAETLRRVRESVAERERRA